MYKIIKISLDDSIKFIVINTISQAEIAEFSTYSDAFNFIMGK